MEFDQKSEGNQGLFIHKVSNKVICPESLYDLLIRMYHNFGHWKSKKLELSIREKWCCLNLSSLKDKIKNMYCKKCYEDNLQFTYQDRTLFVPPTQPLERVGIDLVGPLAETLNGNVQILTVVDYHSGFTQYYGLKSSSAIETARTLLNHFYTFGFPSELISDEGTGFLSNVVKEINNLGRTEHRWSSPYHPECNGRAENANKQLKRTLKNFAGEFPEWDTLLFFAAYCINSSVHTRTGRSPFNVIFNRNAIHPSELNIIEDNPSDLIHPLTTKWVEVFTNLHQSKKNSTTNLYEVGDLVYLKSDSLIHKKFASNLLGPYVIESLQSNVAKLQPFTNEVPTLKNKYRNVNNIAPYKGEVKDEEKKTRKWRKKKNSF